MNSNLIQTRGTAFQQDFQTSEFKIGELVDLGGNDIQFDGRAIIVARIMLYDSLLAIPPVNYPLRVIHEVYSLDEIYCYPDKKEQFVNLGMLHNLSNKGSRINDDELCTEICDIVKDEFPNKIIGFRAAVNVNYFGARDLNSEYSASKTLGSNLRDFFECAVKQINYSR